MGFGYALSRCCKGCKKTRSLSQFDDGFETCRMCRGIKKPVKQFSHLEQRKEPQKSAVDTL